MEPIYPNQICVNNYALITRADVEELTSEEVKQFSDYLFNQCAIDEEGQLKLQQCSFDSIEDKTASKMTKVIDLFILLHGLGDESKLALIKFDTLREKRCQNILEKMIYNLKSNAEIDEKIESSAKGILEAPKLKEVDNQLSTDFDQALDYLLVTGQFEKANSRLKQLAKDLKSKEPSLIDELAPHAFNFVLVNAPCWSSRARKAAIQIAFKQVIPTFNINEIKKHIKMLTTQIDENSINYINDINQYLTFEENKFFENGFKKRAEVIRCSYKMKPVVSSYLNYLEKKALDEEKHPIKKSEKNKKKSVLRSVEKVPSNNFSQQTPSNNFGNKIPSNKIFSNENYFIPLNINWYENLNVQNAYFNSLEDDKKLHFDDLLETVNTLSNHEDRSTAFYVIAHHFLPGKNVNTVLTFGSRIENTQNRLKFLQGIFAHIKVDEKDRLVKIFNKSIIFEMIETSKRITQLLVKNIPLINVLANISSLPNENFRSFLLYRMADCLFPNENIFKWIDKCNEVGSDTERLAKLLDFFENYKKDRADYLHLLEEGEKKKELLNEIDSITGFLEDEQLERLKKQFPDEDHDIISAIYVGCENPLDRREALRMHFNL